MSAFLEYILLIRSRFLAVQDLIVLLLSLVLIVFIFRREAHPIPRLLELVAFVLYMHPSMKTRRCDGLYSFGRSYLMIGRCLPPYAHRGPGPGNGLWLLDKTTLPELGQAAHHRSVWHAARFSLDPLAIRQVFETTTAPPPVGTGISSPRRQHSRNPGLQLPGWMLIMFYGAAPADRPVVVPKIRL